MKFQLRTIVNGHYREVFTKFDRQLFEFLLPKFGEVELVEFGGSDTGDIVHLDFRKPLKAKWISEITENGDTAEQMWFVDQGTRLPFGLQYWRHKHIVRAAGRDRSEIVDDIEFRFANGFLSSLLLPFVYLAFLPRKKLYRKYFNR